jgi:type I restriction enzyme M protein
VDAIVALPTEIFFRTGIGTYIWLLTNNKPESRKGKVQLINATGFWESIKNEGNKRRRISDDQIDDILKIYDSFEASDIVRIMDYKDFGYRRIKVQRPLRMVLKITDGSLEKLYAEKQWLKLTPEQQMAWNTYFEQHKGETLPYRWAEEQQVAAPQQNAAIGKVPKALITALTKSFGVNDADGVPVRNSKGELVADKDLTDHENVPLSESIQDYFTREVLPHVPDAWIDEGFTDDSHLGDGEVGKVGYEINFNRYFYKYEPPRPLETIDAELKQVEADIAALLAEVTE